MTNKVRPLPNEPVSNSFIWREWFYNLGQSIDDSLTIDWANLDFTGSSITDIKSRPHNSLQGLQGGDLSGTQYYHLSASQYSNLTADTYGSFSDTTDQLTTDNTATVVALNTTDIANNMSLASNQITIPNAGLYNLQFSLQFSNTHSQHHNAFVWLRKNGTDIPGTGSKYDVPSTHGSSDGYLIAVANFFVDVNAGDYIELVFAVGQAKIISPAQDGVYLEAYAAITTPFAMPAIPAAVVTLSRVV